jgi:hypothetical protein
VFPLPRIDDVLDLLHGQQYFSTLDLASEYWQIELEEDSKEKTAFIVDNNLYEWNRLAFGLTNDPPRQKSEAINCKLVQLITY